MREPPPVAHAASNLMSLAIERGMVPEIFTSSPSLLPSILTERGKSSKTVPHHSHLIKFVW